MLSPVSQIMSKDVITVSENDPLILVKEIFEENNFHHVPVLNKGRLVGIISKSDLLFFLRGFSSQVHVDNDQVRLKTITAGKIMTSGLGKMESTDRINVAIDIFKKNIFHAIPILEKDNLVGIVTPLDILKNLPA